MIDQKIQADNPQTDTSAARIR